MAKRKQQVTRGEGAELDARLSNYSAVARASATAKGLQGRLGNWPIYAAAAGSAMAMATNASASIIYYGPSNNYGNTSRAPIIPIPVIGATTHSGNIRLDGTGHHLELLASAGSSFGLVSLRGIGKLGIFASAAPRSGSAMRFMPGSVISSKAGAGRPANEVLLFASAGTRFGNFTASHTGFAGLAIADGTLNGQNTEYGWIRLEVLDGLNGFPDALAVIDWAFNNSGGPIAAGEEVAPTPEPGTKALALLACGAAGIMALRRRRKATATQPQL